MPWSNQNGGGPWGGGGGDNQGPKRPSGGNGGNGGNGNGGPPDIEDFFRKGQDQFKGMFPGGFGAGLVFLVGAILVVFWLMQSVYTIQPDQRGVELRFGKPKQEISMAGLHFMLWPIDTVDIVDVSERKLTIGGGTGNDDGVMITGDQNIVDLGFTVVYNVTDPERFLFDVEAPIQTLNQVSESATREVVGRRPADEVYRADREAIPTDVKKIIQSAMDEYGAGITINTVSFQDASPPKQVADSFAEVQRADQDKDRFLQESNQYANKQLGAARGNAAEVREAAAAYKDRVVKEAEGEAQRFTSIYETYKAVPDITRKRLYLETMQHVLSKSKNIIIDDNGQGVIPYLPLDAINKNASQGQNLMPAAQPVAVTKSLTTGAK